MSERWYGATAVTPEDREDFRRMVAPSLGRAARDIAGISGPGAREAACGTFLPVTLLGR